jgi:DNA repair exonuclease SbcCD nuclease subunit
MKKTSLLTAGGTLALALCLGANLASAAPWKFGVLSDTQWTGSPDDGQSPGTTPAGIIQQCDQAFIAQGVKFVIAVGDTVDTGSQKNMDTRALFAQDLYNAGVGFYPYRGNHESGWTGSAAEEARLYPQILNGGTNNLTPADVLTSGYGVDSKITNAAPTGVPFVIGSNFSYPTNVNGTNINSYFGGLSYSFDYNNVRFVLIDQFENQNPGGNLSSAPLQQPWISQVLADSARPQHAFVFDHKNLLGGNHKDNIMGANINGTNSADPGDGSGVINLTTANQAALLAKQQAEDAFISSLATNKVHFYISGHDHHHYDSIVKSPLSNYSVHQIISASDSSKFYVPALPTSTNDTPISQDLFKVGYYIYTVDGPKVTVDYYGVDITTDPSYVKSSSSESIVTNTPVLTGRWQKVLTYGYSLNGQEFVIPEGAAYTTVADTTAKAVANGETGYVGTAMQMLGGVNASTATNNYGKAHSKAVDTGWSPANGTASDILTVWGTSEVGGQVDTYSLSLAYNPASVTGAQISSGAFCLASKDAFGHWANAVDANIGGNRQFVLGAYDSSYPLGTYGVDTASHTVWTVVNHQGDFAATTLSEVVNFVYTSDNHYGIVRPIFRGTFNVSGQTVNEAMIARMNTLPAQSFPNDGGVAAGQAVGNVDFLMDTGDIANRSEPQTAIVATNITYLGASVSYPGNATYTAPISSVTWGQWQHDFLGDANTGNSAGGLLTLTNNAGQGIPVFLSPGNHDVSDAIGMNGKVTGANVDATSFVQIYNRMTPYSGKAAITTNVFANPGNYTNVNLQVNYSFNIGGVHVQCVNMFPDKNVQQWMSADLTNVPATTPVFLFCHVPLNMAASETKVFGTPTNTSSSAGADIPFTLSGTDSPTSYADMNAAKQSVADWLVAHPNVRALFSGHDNFNGATNWKGQDANNNLIAARDSAWSGTTLFRVDSPMKGDVSGVSSTSGSLTGIGMETNLSFQVFSLDIANRRLTEREFYYNNTADSSGNGVWSGQSTTIDLNFPSTAATLSGPASGTVVTNGSTNLSWSAASGATAYVVALTGPSGATTYYPITGTTLALSGGLANGTYSWTVTPVNAAGNGPVSETRTLTLQQGASGTPWKFGVLSDTQWTGSPDDGKSPGTTPAGIIQQCDQAFIAQGVKFVIAVGDTVDTGSQKNMDIRALYAQDLYNAGIGFFPYRGNHESGWTGSAAEEGRIYPQILNGGANNLTPADVLGSTNGIDRLITNTAPAGVPFIMGNNFSYPTNVNGTNINSYFGGLSYSFDYNNVRFVLIDQFENQNAGGNLSSAPLQQPWISQQLADAARPQHAFVFDHKNLLGGNHKDNIMGSNINSSDPGDGAGVNVGALSGANQAALLAKQQAEDAFITSLATNNVHFYISGHDHHHYDSIVQSPLSTNRVHQIISASDSSKFYVPALPTSTNDTPISQDLFKVGYYIYTVDGPKVTVDYYGVDITTDPSYVKSSSSESIVTNTPALTGNWKKVLTYGYSLNGQEFVIPEGAAYTTVADTTAKAVANGETGYIGTAMELLGGVNSSTATNNYGKAHSKAVDTGWSPANGTASDILTVWGTSEIGTNQTDTVALALTYNPASVTAAQLANGSIALVSKDANGNWVNAVNLNTGGNAQFVFGPYVGSYSLGTYGVDTNSGTVWAVVNYQGSFAAGAVANRTNFAALRIATLSDIHYMDPSLLIADGSAFQTYLAGDRKLLAESAAIDKAAIDAVIAQQPDILLVNGDETKDGEYVSHLAVSNLLARVAASGTLVYVIPGNHDVNNANAMSFNGATTTPVANVTPSQFSSIYAPFGYNQAIAKDPNSLAYVVEPVTGLWILCMDSCQYTVGQDPTAGSFSTQRLSWITNELALAQASGKVVIGMMHHGLMEHFVGQKTLFPQYVVDNYQTVASLFASYGMKLVFTGHFHAQDIVQGTFNGNTIYDIETGSTVTYPCPYRLMDLMPNGQFVITSHRISAINYNLGGAADFQTYAYNYLTNGMLGLSAYMLQLPPFSLDSGTANYLAPAVSEALVDHYIGDEPGLAGATPATQTIVSGLLNGSAQQQQLGGAIYSILTDTAPADNNLTLAFTAGEITGPATNTIIVSGSPTLTWAPVWGAGSYHVTVTGPGYSRSFDATGTSLVLSGLANGNYTWSVTPNTGSVSSTGGFAVDYPPTLGIEPSTNGTVHVYWPVSSLSSYQLQFSPDLSGTNWVNVSSNGFFRLVK